MALLNVADVVQGVATLLDDPSQSEIDIDYVLPFINLRQSNLLLNCAMLGLQFGDLSATFDVAPGTTDFAALMASGQPLGSLMQPRRLEWKQVGAPDTEYVDAQRVRDVDDVDGGSIGILQYAWAGGTLGVTPSSVPVTVRLKFQSMSTTLVDPTDDLVRGVGDVLVFRVAEIIYAVRGNDKLKVDCRLWGDTALDDFIAMSTLNAQGILTRIPATHPRGRRRFVARAT